MDKAYTFKDLTDITAKLRSENGCTWDRAQTHESLIPCLMEESGEVRDAIVNKDDENLCEELGDLLKVVGLASVYCYDGDDWAGGWNKDYDILVMVGDPSAADNPIYVGAGPEGESK